MDIEKQLLDGNAGGISGNEDAHERTRAQENEDESQHSDCDDDSEQDSNPKTFQPRDGPQTGVKGVIADYRHDLCEQDRRRKELDVTARAAYAAESKRNINDNGVRTFWTKETPDADDKGSESELDDLSLDEELVFEEYKQERLKQMDGDMANRGTALGALSVVSPEEYAEIVDRQAGTAVPVVVLLLGSGYVSERLLSLFCQSAGDFSHALFLCVHAEECGFTDPDLVPIVLGYRNGALEHNLIRVVDQFSDPINFEQEDVKKLLAKMLLR
ncbi:hypothetical protein EV175_006343 [Coemansia sp. RSA 1933]|nr:hypothetical protein EV175_006343 [Coemansia sp. RSA 1933]